MAGVKRPRRSGGGVEQATAMTDFEHVGRVQDVPLYEGRAATVGGRRIAVFRLADGFVALDAACPHAGGPLADGIVADSCVTCPLHGWRFDLRSGAPVGGGAQAGVESHEVVERDGELYVRVAAPTLEAA
jgi:nitrite reductase (NADH) small subunit